jgi:adenine-specific DNA-methyltransferase
MADIGNGMVSGLDKAFQVNGTKLNKAEQKHTISVAKAKDLEPFNIKGLTRYIFLNGTGIKNESVLQSRFPNIHHHFQKFREPLNARYDYNKDIQYWEWVFLRNYSLFNKNVSKIFIPCKERISHKNHFRFSIAPPGVFPTQDVTCIVPKESTRENIYYILAILNSRYVFDWMKYRGIVKGNIVEFSEKPIHHLPFRSIDWNKQSEVLLHDKISKECEALTKEKGDESTLHKLITRLF